MTRRNIARTPIPKRKKPDVPAGEPITLKFVINGWIPSKKNNQVPAINRKWAINKIMTHATELSSEKSHAVRYKLMISFFKKLIKEIKPYIRYPDSLIKWQESTAELLVQQASHWSKHHSDKKLIFPVTKASISIYHYWADDRNRDNSNKMETINDLLVSTGILADDNYKCLFKITSEAGMYKDEIIESITEIYITAYQW